MKVVMLGLDTDAATGWLARGVGDARGCVEGHLLWKKALALEPGKDLGYRATRVVAEEWQGVPLWVEGSLYSSASGNHHWQVKGEWPSFSGKGKRAARLTSAPFNPSIWAVLKDWQIIIAEGDLRDDADELLEKLYPQKLIIAQSSSYRTIWVVGEPIELPREEAECDLCLLEYALDDFENEETEQKPQLIAEQGHLKIWKPYQDLTLPKGEDEYEDKRWSVIRRELFLGLPGKDRQPGPPWVTRPPEESARWFFNHRLDPQGEKEWLRSRFAYRDGIAYALAVPAEAGAELKITSPDHEGEVVLKEPVLLEHPIPTYGSGVD